ncbi:MAG: siroheme synthase CysG [Pseudomonadota bacterium]
MFFLPLFHNLKGARCLVVGGGQTALRKLKWLLRAEADVTLISPEVCAEVDQLAASGRLALIEQTFAAADVASDYRLIVSATNNTAVNRAVYEHATRHNIQINCVDQPELCTVIFPAIIDRSPLLVAVSSLGVSPTLARVVRGWIEARLPVELPKLAELVTAIKTTVRSNIPGVDGRKVFWERLLTGPAASSALKGDMRSAQAQAEAMLATYPRTQGLISLIGAGPGDPELLTIKALRLLQEADVVLYDQLANEKILDYARRDAEVIYVGKQGPKPGQSADRPDNRGTQQGDINGQLLQHARMGKHVVRLKGGDPFIFGRGGEELEAALDAGIDAQVVPGISAAFGAASSMGIPLTYRNLSQSVRLITGHRVENITNLDWPELGKDGQTLVIYMGLVGLPRITANLIYHGARPDTPAALVENATYPEQRVLWGTLATLADIVAAEEITGPSLVILGDTVGLAEGFKRAAES